MRRIRTTCIAAGMVATSWAAGPAAQSADLDGPKSAAQLANIPPTTERASRLYLRFSLAGGYSAAAYLTTTSATTATRGAVYDVGLSGGDVGLHAAVGSMSSAGLAFGVEVKGALLFLEQHGSLGRTNIAAGLPLQLGGFVDYYHEARGPLHLQSGVAAASMRFAYSVDEAGSPPFTSSVDVRPLFGATAYVGVGYDFGPQGTGGFGLFAQSHFGFFVNGSTNYVPVGLRLGVSMAWL
jgi:hypothetical protein